MARRRNATALPESGKQTPTQIIESALKAGSPIWQQNQERAVTSDERDELLSEAFTAAIPPMPIRDAKYAIRLLEAAMMLYPEDTPDHLAIESAAWFVERRARIQKADDYQSALARVDIVFGSFHDHIPIEDRQAFAMIRQDFVHLVARHRKEVRS